MRLSHFFFKQLLLVLGTGVGAGRSVDLHSVLPIPRQTARVPRVLPRGKLAFKPPENLVIIKEELCVDKKAVVLFCFVFFVCVMS